MLPVVFQYVQIRQINTRLSLGHHWVLAPASVVPVTPQCNCGSSGRPVYSSYANNDFWIATGRPLGGNISQCGSSLVCPVVSQCTDRIWFRVFRSGHFPACNLLCIQMVWRKVLQLSWFYLNSNSEYSKTLMVPISKACVEWCRTAHTFEEQNWYPLQCSKLQVKLNLQRPVHLLLGVPQSCHFKLDWHECYSSA